MANVSKHVSDPAAAWRGKGAEDFTEILENLRDPAADRYDPNGNLEALPPWSMDEAEQRAAAIGIDMTEDHWEVVLLLRDYYCDQGSEADARQMLDALAREFAGDGGRRHLYRLFPGGPVTQGSQIAGIPLPANTMDRSFGTAH
jgi:tRNA 2-thiouridine synthesizing protein E